jgi:hypothetical protein
MASPNARVSVNCRTCDIEKQFDVNTANYYEWLDRKMFAQDAFPHLDPADREMFISQTCGNCWDSMFAEI